MEGNKPGANGISNNREYTDIIIKKLFESTDFRNLGGALDCATYTLLTIHIGFWIIQV